MQTETYLGMDVTRKGNRPLADLPVRRRPSVNDVSTLLANAMHRPLDENATRPKLSRLQGHRKRCELFPVQAALRIEVSVEKQLPGTQPVY